MRKALLIGSEPDADLECEYVCQPPFDLIVIGSLTLGQLLCFRDERVLGALSEGMRVYLYSPGLPQAPHNRALAGAVATAVRDLKNWGVLFTDGGRKRLITAQEARTLRLSGQIPGKDAVMTPLAREILEGSD